MCVVCVVCVCCVCVSLCHVSQVKRKMEDSATCCSRLFSNLTKGKDPRGSLGEPPGHVITLRGPFMVNRNLAIRDDPTSC